MSDKPFKISYSKMSTFRRCLQKYHWKYVQHYYPKSSLGQIRGSSGHAALAWWYETFDVEAALKAAWTKWSSEGLEDGEDWQLLQDTLLRYFEWSKKHDEFKIISSEYEFNIHYENPEVIFNGFIDGIVEENGQQWLLENKFNKRVTTTGLEMDMQATSYLYAAVEMQKNVRGVIYNIIRVGTKKAETEPVVRKRLHRSLSGLQYVQHEILQQANAMIAYQKGGIPYRNPTKDCSWDCPFYSACLSLLDDGVESKQQLENVCYTDRKEE